MQHDGKRLVLYFSEQRRYCRLSSHNSALRVDRHVLFVYLVYIFHKTFSFLSDLPVARQRLSDLLSEQQPFK